MRSVFYRLGCCDRVKYVSRSGEYHLPQGFAVGNKILGEFHRKRNTEIVKFSRFSASARSALIEGVSMVFAEDIIIFYGMNFA
jgi:hypothetical protein